MIITFLALASAQPTANPNSDYADWYECTVSQRDAFLKSKEPVEVLASAVMSACSSHERAAVSRLMKNLPVNRDVFEGRRFVAELVAEVHSQIRGTVIEYYVRKRLPPG